MAKKAHKKKQVRSQFGALPYQMRDGRLFILLVTSRETRRWIIPKGLPEKHLSPGAVARGEAYEEAGLRGDIHDKPCGSYDYKKRLKSGRQVPCRVEVYPLKVAKELDDWPEKKQRERRWVAAAEAALLVEEAGLTVLIAQFLKLSEKISEKISAANPK